MFRVVEHRKAVLNVKRGGGFVESIHFDRVRFEIVGPIQRALKGVEQQSFSQPFCPGPTESTEARSIY